MKPAGFACGCINLVEMNKTVLKKEKKGLKLVEFKQKQDVFQ